jgi:hypothetical protein
MINLHLVLSKLRSTSANETGDSALVIRHQTERSAPRKKFAAPGYAAGNLTKLGLRKATFLGGSVA